MDGVKPWQQHADWQPPFRSQAKSQLWMIWGMAAVWNAISAPLAFMIPGELAQGNYAALVGLAFPLIGIAIIHWGVKTTREFKKFGALTLELDPYPGSIGGHLGGTLKLPASAGAEARYTVSVLCQQSYVKRSGSKRKRRERTVWQVRGPALATLHATGVQLAFRFDLPAELAESQQRSGDFHFWKIVLESDHEGIALNRAFEVPVFKTRTPSQNVEVDSLALAAEASRQAVADALSNPAAAAKLRSNIGLSLDVRSDWIRLYFHPGRQKGMAIALLLVGLPFMAVYWLPDEDGLTTIFRYLFGFAGLALTLGGLYVPFNSLDVRVNRNEITRIRSWLGISIKRQRIKPSQISEIHIEEGASSSNKNRKIQYYRLVGRGDFGEFRFAETIEDLTLLKALQEKIRGFAGISAAQ